MPVPTRGEMRVMRIARGAARGACVLAAATVLSIAAGPPAAAGSVYLGLAQSTVSAPSSSDGGASVLLLGSAGGVALLGLIGAARWRRSGRAKG